MFGSKLFFFFKQKTAYELRISDWSSDVCSSDLCFLWEMNMSTYPMMIRPANNMNVKELRYEKYYNWCNRFKKVGEHSSYGGEYIESTIPSEIDRKSVV